MKTIAALLVVAVCIAGCVGYEVDPETGDGAIVISKPVDLERVRAGEARQDKAIEGLGQSLEELAAAAGEEAIAKKVEMTIEANEGDKRALDWDDLGEDPLVQLIGAAAAIFGVRVGTKKLVEGHIAKRAIDPEDELYIDA
jgi:hypothetical protein